MQSAERFQKSFLLLLVVAISLLFLAMISGFLMPVFLAGIFAGLAAPLYRRILHATGDRASLSSGITLVILLVGVVLPVGLFAGIVTEQAIQITNAARPFIEEQLEQAGSFQQLMARFPFLQRLEPFQAQIMGRMGDLAGGVGGFLVNSLASVTTGAAAFLLALFIMIYAMFFFLRDGPSILDRILYLMPLSAHQEARMVERFVSVTRATIKGTLVIGVVQGGLAGAALAAAGIHGAAFWGTVMAVLSVIPGVGTALVWVPAVIYLGASGKMLSAILVALWCALVVGTADNFLRPALVGRDTEMSDLMILLSTLGGLVMFGAAGIVIGPIIAALFVTGWDLYAGAFREFLPETNMEEVAEVSGQA